MTSKSESTSEPQPAARSAASPVEAAAPHPETSRFDRSRRLRSARQFTAVYRGRTSERMEPLVVYAVPNDLPHARLGLSVPRRVGSAVARNRIKRLLREVFRHHQCDLPSGYDFVINVRNHDMLAKSEYELLLTGAMRRLHERWVKKCRKQESGPRASRNIETPRGGG